MHTNDSVININTTLKNQVYNVLKNDIVFGRIRSGEQLVLLDLSKRLNISSAPIREALNMLAQEGLVDLNPRKRATVSTVNKGDIETIVYLRNSLEPYAAKMSAGRIPVDEIARLRTLMNRVLEEPSNREQYIKSDLELHEILHQYAGSPLLSEIISNVKDRSIRLRYISDQCELDDNSPARIAIVIASTHEHLEILDALEQGDQQSAHQKVLQHIFNYSIRAQEAVASEEA